MLIPLMVMLTLFGIGFIGLSVDVGYMYTIRNQLQQALDMAALRGAVEMIAMPNDPDEIERVVERALEGNPIFDHTDIDWRWTLAIRGDGNSSGDTVLINGRYDFTPFFMTLFGFEELSVNWQSRAKLLSVISAYCFIPYTLTDRFIDSNSDGIWNPGEPVPGFDGSTDIGELMWIQYHDPGDPPRQNMIYGVYYEEGPGYDEIWCNSGDKLIEIGDRLNRIVHNGGIVALKAQTRINQDPWAHWDNESNTVQSNFWEHEIFKCPRIVKVPVHHPQNPDIITKFLCVFIEDVNGNQVLVRTMNIVNFGYNVGYSDAMSFVKSARLIMPPNLGE